MPQLTLTNRDFRPGDLIGFSGRDLASRAIKAGTVRPEHWFQPDWENISHIGICCPFEKRVALVEATTLCDQPCIFTSSRHSGLQGHWPEERVANYPGFVFLARLSVLQVMTPDESRQLNEFLLDFQGRQYDWLGALRAGAGTARDEDLSQLFCSEVVAAALIRLGRLTLSNPSQWTPAALYTEVVRSSVYDQPWRVH